MAISMVNEEKVNGRILFLCEICGLGYLDKAAAQNCENWCKKTGTCNIAIIKKAVYFPGLSDRIQKFRK
jgi:hypothetical protein